MFGSAARMMTDYAIEDGARQKIERKPRQHKLTPARAMDAIPADQCPRCGMIGEHVSDRECIQALRDRLSKFE